MTTPPTRLLLFAALAAFVVRPGVAQIKIFETLYSFQGSPDGANPLGGLLIAKDGQLYGTTNSGGASGDGTVFTLTPATGTPWNETVLYNFSGQDGANSASTLVFGSTGALYGTTTAGGVPIEGGPQGGTGAGTVFQLAPPSTAGGVWTETVLYTFDPSARGKNKTPNGSVLMGPGGELYVTTQGNYGFVPNGSVDAVMPPATPGGAWTGSALATFDGGPQSGSTPFGGLVARGDGLFGTVDYGGDNTVQVGNYCCGEVYVMTPPVAPGGAWTLQTVYAFTGPPGDGASPQATLTVGPGGVLYGTTSEGGAGSCGFPSIPGCGTVFQLRPPSASGGTWTESALYSFTGLNGDGAYPTAGVVMDENGALYGTTQKGGRAGLGTVFVLTPPATPGGAWTETVLHNFSGRNGDGATPVAGLARSNSGVLYGTTSAGGASGQGTVFAIMP